MMLKSLHNIEKKVLPWKWIEVVSAGKALSTSIITLSFLQTTTGGPGIVLKVGDYYSFIYHRIIAIMLFDRNLHIKDLGIIWNESNLPINSNQTSFVSIRCDTMRSKTIFQVQFTILVHRTVVTSLTLGIRKR